MGPKPGQPQMRPGPGEKPMSLRTKGEEMKKGGCRVSVNGQGAEVMRNTSRQSIKEQRFFTHDNRKQRFPLAMRFRSRASVYAKSWTIPKVLAPLKL
jgi:hypothetical protein